MGSLHINDIKAINVPLQALACLETFQNRLTQLVWLRVIYSDLNSINSTKTKRYSRPRQRRSNTRVMTLRLLNANRRVNEI